MGLMDRKDVLAISDRIGKRYSFLVYAAVSGSPDSLSAQGVNFYEMAHVCPDGDPEVEITTLTQARASDLVWNEDSAPFALATSLMSGLSSSYGIIGALTTHFNSATLNGARALPGSWNQYLETADSAGTPYATMPTFPSLSGSYGEGGVRVSEYFRRVYTSAGGPTLRARNVFYDAPDPFTFGTITGTTGNEITYASVGDFGGGTANDTADGSAFAATRMKIVVGAGGWTDETTLSITLVTEPDGDTETVTVTIPALSVAGAEVVIGADGLKPLLARYTKVNDVEVASGDTTVGETLSIVNMFERVIAL